MTTCPHLFDRLDTDLSHRLRSPVTRPVVARWATAEPALAGCSTALEAGLVCRDREAPGGGRPALTALVHLAAQDRVALEAAMFGVVPALRATAAGLCRAWGADRDGVDQAVAAAGWARLVAVAGRDLGWPDRTIAAGARVAVRDRFRSATRAGRRLTTLTDDPTVTTDSDGGLGVVEAVDVLERAVWDGRISAGAAGLVWATRVAGVPPGEAGRALRCSAKAVTMTCLRAERALRAAMVAAA